VDKFATINCHLVDRSLNCYDSMHDYPMFETIDDYLDLAM